MRTRGRRQRRHAPDPADGALAGGGREAVRRGGGLEQAREPRLREHLGDASDVLVLITPGTTREAVHRLHLPSVSEIRDLSAAVPRPRQHDVVVLAVQDLVALRRAITGVANFGTARRVVVWFERAVTRLPTVAPAPSWPRLDALVASRSGDHFVLLVFESHASVRRVLLHIAAAAAPSGRLAVAWPALGVLRDQPARWPVADPSATVTRLPRLLDRSIDSPPDLLLLGAEATDHAEIAAADHPVLGRATRTTLDEPDPSWAELASAEEVAGALTRLGATSLGAVDEQLINPIGFERDPVEGLATLSAKHGDTFDVLTNAGSVLLSLDAERGLSETDVPALRRLAGIRLDWSGGRGPLSYCRLVAGLAMAGVPLVADRVPSWAGQLLARELVEALSGPVDLTDRLHREEHSVRLRRVALRFHAARPWRRRVAQAHGLQQMPHPKVSVLVTTRRPEMLSFALRQVTRQRGVDFELILATHGFGPEPNALDAFREACPAPLTTLRAHSSTSFGEVLNLAAAHAAGDLLLKMDDDDWYGPDFVGDLVLAHGYSGAEVVGSPAEFTFLHPLWLTTRPRTPTEVYGSRVAGGTMLIDRGAFLSVGGFRHTVKYVDANMLAAVAADGGSIYRTHGLGYVLRRAANGHTWDPNLGHFLKGERATDQWRGFRPSALLTVPPEDHPVRLDA